MVNRHNSLKGTLHKEILTTNAILKYLDSLKAWSVKVHGGPSQEIGLPDIIACYRGIFIGIEVKGPGKKKNLTPRQAYHLDRIRKSGGVSLVAETVEEVKEEIERIDALVMNSIKNPA